MGLADQLRQTEAQKKRAQIEERRIETFLSLLSEDFRKGEAWVVVNINGHVGWDKDYSDGRSGDILDAPRANWRMPGSRCWPALRDRLEAEGFTISYKKNSCGVSYATITL